MKTLEVTPPTPWTRRRRAYFFVVLTVANGLLLFAALEIVASAVLAWRDKAPPPLSEAMRSVYEGMEVDEIRQLLDETWQPAWRYEPWVGFREAPRRGRYVNIHESGFRLNGAEEPDFEGDGFDLFIFGGSTVFGYGVDDPSTLTAHLEAQLTASYGSNFRVFNFGRGYYYSAQELALFTDLLRRGLKPEMAIFVDGLNEGQPFPHYTAESRRLFSAYNQAPWQLTGIGMRRVGEGLALTRIARKVLGLGQATASPALPPAEPELVRDAYLFNRQLIAAAAESEGVEAFFFIQPVPGHRNRFADHPLMRFEVGPFPDDVDPRMSQLEETADGITSFSLTHLLADYPRQAFVDSFHYTPEVNALLATAIRQHLESAVRAKSDGV